VRLPDRPNGLRLMTGAAREVKPCVGGLLGIVGDCPQFRRSQPLIGAVRPGVADREARFTEGVRNDPDGLLTFGQVREVVVSGVDEGMSPLV
jgi:hypothetical protein